MMDSIHNFGDSCDILKQELFYKTYERFSSLNWSEYLNKIVDNFSTKSTFQSKNFNILKQNSDRVKKCFEDEYLRKIITDFIYLSNKFNICKNDDKSSEFRIRGNNEYSAKRFPQAIHLYTLAILYAPKHDSGSESLALAYGNRSAVYYHCHLFSSCIDDIDEALNAGYEKFKQKKKLLIRKCECLISEKKFKEAKELLPQIYLNINEDTKLREDYDDDRCLARRLELIGMDDIAYTSPSKEILCQVKHGQKFSKHFMHHSNDSPFNDKIEIRYNDVKGRHVYATDAIEPGEIIALENPYSCVLLASYESSYCHHCCRKLQYRSGSKTSQKNIQRNMFPCSQCVNVLYCSTTCRTDSWNAYHQFECNFLLILHQIGIGHLALRILFVTDFNEILSCFESNTHERSLLKPSSISSYYDVFNLVHHSDKFSYQDVLQYSITACLLLELTIESGWIQSTLSQHPQLDRKHLETIVGGVLLRHILQLVTNAHSISHFMGDCSNEDISGINDGNSRARFTDVRLATALYPAISLFNHSCDPNVVATFDQGTMNLLRASKRIEPNTEINNGYGVHFARYRYDERQDLLWSQYFFKCTCPPCRQESLQLKLNGQSTTSSFSSIKLNELGIKIETKLDQCKTSDTQLEDIKKLLLQYGNVLNDMSVKISSEPKIDYFERRTRLELGEHHDQLSYYWYGTGLDLGKAAFHCEQSVQIVESVYGTTSMELCNELVKLCDLYYTQWKNNSKQRTLDHDGSPIQKMCDTMKRTVELLQLFSVTTTESEDMCYFGQESKRIESRLEMINKSLT